MLAYSRHIHTTSSLFMAREYKLYSSTMTLAIDPQGLVNSVEHVSETCTPHIHTGAQAPNVSFTRHRNDLQSYIRPRGPPRVGKQPSSLPWTYDEDSTYAAYIETNNEPIASSLPKSINYDWLKHINRSTSQDTDRSSTSVYSSVAGYNEEDDLLFFTDSSPPINLPQSTIAGCRPIPSLAQCARSVTPEPRTNQVRLHSSKGLLCNSEPVPQEDNCDPHQSGVFESLAMCERTSFVEDQSPWDKIDCHRDSQLTTRTFPTTSNHQYDRSQICFSTRSMHVNTYDSSPISVRIRHSADTARAIPCQQACLMKAPAWASPAALGEGFPTIIRQPALSDPLFVPKADRILGETSYTRGRSRLRKSESISSTDYRNDQVLSGSKCSSLPLPIIPQQSRNPADDIKAFISRPTFTQRIKLNGNGRIVSFSVVGDCDGLSGHPVFLYPGLGYTRFISIFLLELAIANDLRLVTIDGPGQGFSEKLSTGVEPDTAQVLVSVAEALSIERFSVMAFGTGAMDVIKLASHLPDRIIGPIILLSPLILKSQLIAKAVERNIIQWRILEKLSPVKSQLLAASMFGLHPQRQHNPGARLSDRSSIKGKNEICDSDGFMMDSLWHVSTSPTKPRYLLRTQIATLSQTFVSNLTAEFRIVHQVHDTRKPINLARHLCDFLPNCSMKELPGDGRADLLLDPIVMAKIFESLRRRIDH